MTGTRIGYMVGLSLALFSLVSTMTGSWVYGLDSFTIVDCVIGLLITCEVPS